MTPAGVYPRAEAGQGGTIYLPLVLVGLGSETAEQAPTATPSPAPSATPPAPEAPARPLPPAPPGLLAPADTLTRPWRPAARPAVVHTVDAGLAELDLVPGWNLIALPLAPPDDAVAAVLAPISGKYDLVYAYDACDAADPWKSYDPSAPPFINDLQGLSPDIGFWINMTGAATLPVAGQPILVSQHVLCEGWNLAGYPSAKAEPLPAALDGLAGAYDLAYGYVAADGGDPWKSFDPTAPPFVNDLQALQSGMGYWLHLLRPANLTISNSYALPQVVIETPAEGAIFGQPIVHVTGVVTSEVGIASVTVNGEPATVTGAATAGALPATPQQEPATFAADVTLDPGSQLISVVATDVLGQQGTAGRAVQVDGEGPQITILEPQDRQAVYTTTPEVAISYSDALAAADTATLRVIVKSATGAETDITGNLTITATGASGTSPALTTDASYTLTVSLADTFGHSATALARFYMPPDPETIIPPVAEPETGWISGVVFDSSTCDQDMTTCVGLPGARVTIESVDTAVLSQVRVARKGAILQEWTKSQKVTPMDVKTVPSFTQAVEGTVVTGPDGFFAFPIADSGIYWLRVEKQDYTYAQREAIVAKERSTATNAIYVTPLDSAVTPCNATGCSHTNSDDSIEITIPQGAVPAGETLDVSATNFRNVEYLPSGELPPATWETYAFNLSDDSQVVLAQPATVRIRNTLGFSPGSQIPMGYWNQSTQQWEHAGVATVNSTGEWVEGSITHFSMYDWNHPISLRGSSKAKAKGDSCTGSNCACPAGEGSCFISLKSGTLQEDVQLPTVSTVGKDVAPTLAYASDRSLHASAIDVSLSLNPDSGVVLGHYVGYELYVGGAQVAKTSLSAVLEQGEVGRFRFLWDGRDSTGRPLPAGPHEYSVRLRVPYRAQYCAPVTLMFGDPPDCVNKPTGVFVDATDDIWVKGVVQLGGNPGAGFGAGWVLAESQHLYANDAGQVMIADPSGATAEYYFMQKDERFVQDSSASQQTTQKAPAAAASGAGSLVPKTMTPPVALSDTPNKGVRRDSECYAQAPHTSGSRTELLYNGVLPWANAATPRSSASTPGVVNTPNWSRMEPVTIPSQESGLPLPALAHARPHFAARNVAAGDEGLTTSQIRSAGRQNGSEAPVTRLLKVRGPNTSVCGTLGANTAWTASASPYVLTCSVVVPSGVTLTVEPGVTMMGQSGAALRVYGDLQALGTPTQPIIFTSATDTGPAQWIGIIFDGGTGHLRSTTVRFGGSVAGNPCGYGDANVVLCHVENGQVLIEDSQVMHGIGTGGDGAIEVNYSHLTVSNTLLASSGHGLLSRNSQITLIGSTIADNIDRGVTSIDSQVTISDTTFRNNGNAASKVGLSIEAASVVAVTSSAFVDHLGSPITIDAAAVPGVSLSGNTFTTNHPDRIVIRGGTIGSNAALATLDAPFQLAGTLSVPTGITLTVEPGVTVMGQSGAGVWVYGDLQAIGTATKPITFTSAIDTGPTQWPGLIFNGGTGHLQHVVVRYGGQQISTSCNAQGGNVVLCNVPDGQVLVEDSLLTRSGGNAAIDAQKNSHLTLSNTQVLDNNAHGIYGSESRLTLSGDTIADNLDCGIASLNSQLSVAGSTLRNNGFLAGYTYPYGLFIQGASSSVSVTNSAFVDHVKYPIAIDAVALPGVSLSTNTFSGNHPDHILIRGGTLASNATLATRNAPFELAASISVASAATLTVEPGVTVMGQSGAGVWVYGDLQAIGTATKPITFTSAIDTGPTQWPGLIFNGGTGHLQHVVVRYGGQQISTSCNAQGGNVVLCNVPDGQVLVEDSLLTRSGGNAAIDARNSYLTVDRTQLVDNEGHGIGGNAGMLSVNNSTISGNSVGIAAVSLLGPLVAEIKNSVVNNNRGIGIHAETITARLEFVSIENNGQDGIHAYGLSNDLYITASNFVGNAGKALVSDGGLLIDARNNWWGDPTGPAHPTENPLGLGSAVSVNVRVTPWLGSRADSSKILNLTATDHTTLTYDAASDTYTRHYPDGKVVHFNPDGTHDYTLDADGRKTAYTYNPDQSVATMSIAPPGAPVPSHTWTFQYTLGKLSSITDPGGRVTQFTVDGHNNLTQATFPDGTDRRFAYDSRGLMTQQTNQNGAVMSYAYDGYGRIKTATYPPRAIYHPDTGQTVVEQEVRTFTNSDTSYPLLNDSPSGSPTNPAPAAPKSAALVVGVQYGRGGRSGHVNEWGAWLDETDGLGRTTTYVRDDQNNLLRQTDPNGDCVEYTYDDLGNVLTESRMGKAQCDLPADQRAPAQIQKWTRTYEPRFNHLKSETDPLGHTTTYIYDYEEGAGEAGNLIRIKYPAVPDENGQVVTPAVRTTYNSLGLKETETDPRGVVTRYEYTQGTPDEAAGGANPLFAAGVTPVPGLLTKVIADYGDGSHLNATTVYKEFDAAGNPLTVLGPAASGGAARIACIGCGSSGGALASGAEAHYTYDAWGRVLAETDALGIVTRNEYDGKGNLVRKTLDYTADGVTGRNVVTEYTYDPQGQLLSERTAADGVIQQTTHPYDVNRKLASRTDANGNTTTFTYDAADQLIAETDPLGYTTAYTYTLTGRPLTVTGPDGMVTRYEYDAYGRRTAEVTDADGLALATRTTYDANDNVLTVTDPAGAVTCYTYDAHNRRTGETRDCTGLALTTTYVYDLADNLVRTTDERGVVTIYGYDALGRQTSMRQDANGLNLTTTYAYDLAGNLVSSTDERGVVTANEYDAMNRLTRTCADAAGLNLCTTYTYDRLGNRQTVTDPAGVTTRTETNAFGRLVRQVQDDGGLSAVTSYVYDNNLNLTAITDANGHATRYTFDGRNQLLETRYADGSAVTNTYHPNGAQATRTDQAGATVNFGYDSARRLTGKAYPDGSTATFAYDAAGRMISADQTMSGHTTGLTFAYNALGDTTGTTQTVDGHTWNVGYEYDYAAGATATIYPSGSRVVHAPDRVGRLQQVTQDGAAVATYAYDDAAGTMTLAHANGVTTVTETDPLRRITRVHTANPTETIADYRYGYDPAGNRTYMQRAHKPGAPADVYQYDGLYQLTQVWYGANATDPAAITAYDKLQTYKLDTVGNRLEVVNDGVSEAYQPNDGTRLTDPLNRYQQVDANPFTYDPRGNLTGDGTNTYTYDYENRQIGMTGPGGAAEYVYDARGWRIAEISDGETTNSILNWRYQVIEERDSPSVYDAIYTYGAGIDEPLTVQRPGSTQTYHRDALGSITEITGLDGNLVGTNDYRVYGTLAGVDSVSPSISPTENRYLFVGRLLDSASNSYHFRAREYSPSLGRFLQLDPIAAVANSVNRYDYALANPTNLTDPLGTSGFPPLPPQVVNEIIELIHLCTTNFDYCQQLYDLLERLTDELQSGEGPWNDALDFAVDKIDKALEPPTTLCQPTPCTLDLSMSTQSPFPTQCVYRCQDGQLYLLDGEPQSCPPIIEGTSSYPLVGISFAPPSQ